jgi:hypothetical protein
MKRKMTIPVLFLILLVSCTATRGVIPDQDTNSEGPEISATMTYLAEDIDIGDGGLLSGQPCPSPCAFGVQIGGTQLDQVIPVLEANGISRCWTEPNLSWSLVSCGANRLNVQVDMHTRLVNAIWFHPSVSISLGDIIEKYAEPDHVTLDQEVPGSIHPRLYWSSLRMAVLLPQIPGNMYAVEKDTRVEVIDFTNEALYRISENESNPYYRPWNGYGIYQAPVEPTPSLPILTATMPP